MRIAIYSAKSALIAQGEFPADFIGPNKLNVKAVDAWVNAAGLPVTFKVWENADADEFIYGDVACGPVRVGDLMRFYPKNLRLQLP